MAIDHISPQAPHWDRNVNEVIDAVNTLMGGVEPTHLTDPVTYVNGTTGNGSEAWIWKLGSVKLAIVFLKFFKLGENASGQVIGKLPDALLPYSDFQAPVNQDGLITNGYGPSTDLYYYNWNGTNTATNVGDRRATLFYIAK